MNTAAHTPTTHSRVVGGSTSGRVKACPHSIDINANAPNKSSPASREGTALHDAMAYLLTTDELETDLGLIGTTWEVEGDKYEITHDLFESCVLPCIEWLDTIVEPDEQFMVEQSITYPDIPEAFGTADVIIENGILDWKFGGELVRPEDNDQLMYYLWAAIHDPRTQHMFDKGPDSIYTVGIGQPRRDNFNTWNVTWERLVEEHAKLLEAVKPENRGNGATGDHCGYCHKAGCKILEAQHNKLDRHLKSLTAEELKGAEPEDEEDFVELLELIHDFEIWADGVRSRAKDKLMAGARIPGQKLVQKYGKLAWSGDTDPQKLGRRIHSRLGLTAQEYQVKKIITPTQALKLYRDRMAKETGEPAKSFDLPDGMAERPKGAIAMVKASAKGEAYVPTATVANQLGEALKAAE